MIRCGEFRGRGGVIYSPPTKVKDEGSAEFARRYTSWLGTIPIGTNTRCACDPEHPHNKEANHEG